MSLPLFLILFISYAYSLLIFLYYLEIEQEALAPVDPGEELQKFSVVIPFRNEEQQLKGILEDLTGQTVPPQLWEIVFVNDHSTDNSAQVLSSLKDPHLQIRSLDLPAGISGKKAALSHGIRHANYERIIQVDADCRVGPGFVSAHMAFFRDHPSDLVAGMVTTGKGRGGFLESFERLDNLGLVGASAGSFNLGRPMMCSGANLSYSKKLYEETRGFDPAGEIASGDDMFLMIGARKLGKKLAYISDRESIVRTAPSENLRALLKQRIRWGSKAFRYKMVDIQLLALLVMLCNVSVLLMPLWFFIFPGWWPWLAGAWLFKYLADFMLLYKMTGISGARNDLKMFLPVTLLYYPYFLVTVLGSLGGKPSWKGGSR